MNLGRLKNSMMNIDEHSDEPWTPVKLHDEPSMNTTMNLGRVLACSNDERQKNLKMQRWTLGVFDEPQWTTMNQTMNVRNVEPNDEHWPKTNDEPWAFFQTTLNIVEQRWTNVEPTLNIVEPEKSVLEKMLENT